MVDCRLPRLAAFAAVCAAWSLASGAPAGAAPEGPDQNSDAIGADYIVVFEDSVGDVAANANRRERRLGFETDLRFRHTVSGFSARLSPDQVEDLRRDPQVDFVARDRRLEAYGEVPLASGDESPTGVRRILAATEATARERSGVSVAVLDTGIDVSHPDLNARHGINCTDSPANDGDGHGTHVAGTIAAKNNGVGVVGVTPGTEVHAVKVLDDDGEGTDSSVICGIDWVTANRGALGIRVANMSLGGESLGPVRSCASTTDAMHKAICESTAAGVNYVVAAGNQGRSFDGPLLPEVPAAYPEALTVTAMSDSDGRPGGSGGPPGCRRGELDDAAASFSNFASTRAGEAQTIAAPGVCIESTWPEGSGYRTASGTSMASSHVAGVVALCINEAGADGPCAGKTPSAVIRQVRSDAEAFNGADPGYGFLGDPSLPLPGVHYGFLTRTLPPPAPPATTNGDPPPNGDQKTISNRFRFGRVTRNPRRGMARLIVRLPGPGRVLLRRTKRVRRAVRRAQAAGPVRLRVRRRGKAQRRISQRRCQRSGKRRLRVRVRARVTYRPSGGAPRTKQRRVRLVRRC